MASWKLYAYVGYPEDTSWPAGPTNTALLGDAVTWSVSPGDAAAFGMIADGLSIVRSIPADKPWPAQYDPATLTFSVIAESVADANVVELVRGRPVSLYLHLEAAPNSAREPDEWFHGRISDVVLNPHVRGVIAQVTCVDYTADLAVPTGTGDDRLAETMEARLGWMAEAVTPFPPTEDITDWLPDILQLGTTDVAARSAALVSFYDEVVASLEYGVQASLTDRPYRLVLVPAVDDNPMAYVDGVAYNYWQGFHFRDVMRDWAPGDILVPPYDREVELPATFQDVPGSDGYGVVIDPDAATYSIGQMVLAGDAVDMGVAWTQRKDDPNAIEVKGPWGPAGAEASVRATAADPGAALVVHEVATQLTDETDAEAVATVYLPLDLPDNTWAVDSVQWHLDLEPNHPKTPELGGLVVIWPIKPEWNPNSDRDYHLAMVGGKQLTLVDGKPRMTLTLRTPNRRIVNPTGGAGALQWDDVPVGVTWDDLNSRDSWTDYSLIRRF